MCQQSFPSVCLDGLITTLRRYGLHWAGIIEIFASADRIAFVPPFPTGCVRHPQDKSRWGADIPELSLRDPLNLLAPRRVPRNAITPHTFVSQPHDHNHLRCQMDILTATQFGILLNNLAFERRLILFTTYMHQSDHEREHLTGFCERSILYFLTLVGTIVLEAEMAWLTSGSACSVIILNT
jgi:hypothetical protein